MMWSMCSSILSWENFLNHSVEQSSSGSIAADLGTQFRLLEGGRVRHEVPHQVLGHGSLGVVEKEGRHNVVRVQDPRPARALHVVVPQGHECLLAGVHVRDVLDPLKPLRGAIFLWLHRSGPRHPVQAMEHSALRQRQESDFPFLVPLPLHPKTQFNVKTYILC